MGRHCLGSPEDCAPTHTLHTICSTQQAGATPGYGLFKVDLQTCQRTLCFLRAVSADLPIGINAQQRVLPLSGSLDSKAATIIHASIDLQVAKGFGASVPVVFTEFRQLEVCRGRRERDDGLLIILLVYDGNTLCYNLKLTGRLLSETRNAQHGPFFKCDEQRHMNRPNGTRWTD
jgi:hypothetical protein